MKNRVVSVTEFKARCLGLLDEIGSRGGTITVTKRGRPLATVGPAEIPAWKSPEGSWAKKVNFATDPLAEDMTDFWEAVNKADGSRP